jgi:hypothetical protein
MPSPNLYLLASTGQVGALASKLHASRQALIAGHDEPAPAPYRAPPEPGQLAESRHVAKAKSAAARPPNPKPNPAPNPAPKLDAFDAEAVAALVERSVAAALADRDAEAQVAKAKAEAEKAEAEAAEAEVEAAEAAEAVAKESAAKIAAVDAAEVERANAEVERALAACRPYLEATLQCAADGRRMPVYFSPASADRASSLRACRAEVDRLLQDSGSYRSPSPRAGGVAAAGQSTEAGPGRAEAAPRLEAGGGLLEARLAEAAAVGDGQATGEPAEGVWSEALGSRGVNAAGVEPGAELDPTAAAAAAAPWVAGEERRWRPEAARALLAELMASLQGVRELSRAGGLLRAEGRAVEEAAAGALADVRHALECAAGLTATPRDWEPSGEAIQASGCANGNSSESGGERLGP